MVVDIGSRYLYPFTASIRDKTVNKNQGCLLNLGRQTSFTVGWRLFTYVIAATLSVNSGPRGLSASTQHGTVRTTTTTTDCHRQHLTVIIIPNQHQASVEGPPSDHPHFKADPSLLISFALRVGRQHSVPTHLCPATSTRSFTSLCSTYSLSSPAPRSPSGELAILIGQNPVLKSVQLALPL